MIEIQVIQENSSGMIAIQVIQKHSSGMIEIQEVWNILFIEALFTEVPLQIVLDQENCRVFSQLHLPTLSSSLPLLFLTGILYC